MPVREKSPLYLIWETIQESYRHLATKLSTDDDDSQLVYPIWRNYDGFAIWAVTHGYQEGLFLTRLDADHGYVPDNCYWSNVQSPSKRMPLVITAFGINKCLAAWLHDPHSVVPKSLLYDRLKNGWAPERALTTPATTMKHYPPLTSIAVGAVCGQLTVIGAYREERNQRNEIIYRYPCRCSCGTEIYVNAKSLLYGHTHSCGCRKRTAATRRCTTHGETRTRLYQQWQTLQQRARTQCAKLPTGILRLEAAWVTDYLAFRTWAQEHGYSDDRFLARRDTTRGFTADNCQWVDRRTQIYVCRKVKIYPAFGEAKSLPAWAADFRSAVPYKVLLRRIHKGWTLETALITPDTPPPARPMTAFGETKTMYAWARDARCKVAETTLKQRVRVGWTLEAALNTPPAAPIHNITSSRKTKVPVSSY